MKRKKETKIGWNPKENHTNAHLDTDGMGKSKKVW